jgi:PIN domain nuclease of toxin-antitoxin system
MRILLDTHAWLWCLEEPQRLNRTARNLVNDPDNQLFLSVASAWEMAIKYALGKLPLPAPPVEFIPSRLARDGVLGLPVNLSHALRVAALPHHHRDPFDRLLVAQAQVERLTLLTADPHFRMYDVEVVGAGG